MPKHAQVKPHLLYEWDYEKGTIVPKNKRCPRCGSFMAHHLKPVPRWHCGKCGYTLFETEKQKQEGGK